jgi:hypothetical protein
MTATVSLIGHIYGSYTTSYAIPVGASGVAAGNGIVIIGTSDKIGAITFSVTDSSSNTYQTDVVNCDDYAGVVLLSGRAGTALNNGHNITITPSTDGHWTFFAYKIDSWETSNWFDQGASAYASYGSSWTVGPTGNTTNANDVVFVAFGNYGSAVPTFSSPYNALNSYTDLYSIRAAYKEVSATGAQSCTVSVSPNDSAVGGIAAYKLAAGGGATRTALNTRSEALGLEIGMGWRMPI